MEDTWYSDLNILQSVTDEIDKYLYPDDPDDDPDKFTCSTTYYQKLKQSS